MSTRSVIGIELGAGKERKIHCVYCHSDGYPEHNGVYLGKYYDTEKKAQQLVNLGDLSYIGKGYNMQLSEKSWKTGFDKDDIEADLANDATRAYKDRGEQGTEPREVGSIQEDCREQLWFAYELEAKDMGAEYAYVFSGGSWWYKDLYKHSDGDDENDGWVKLTEDLVFKMELEQELYVVQRKLAYYGKNDLAQKIGLIAKEQEK